MNRINTKKRAGKLAIFLFFTFLSLTTVAQNKEKKLPQPQPIVLHHIDEYHEPVVELTEAQQYAIDMFGDEIVEFEE